ncbi:PhoU domain-containing protein [Desulfitobacterium sp. THU1]|uniref:phosphate signaling complex PhoU family protein n=1 Tax=Desulfitobacterium sp. THU1 TaxID=3138072 RepID=UPI00311DE126
MTFTRLSGYDRALMEIRAMILELAQGVKHLLSRGLSHLETPDALQDVDWRTEDDKIDAMRDKVLNRILEMMTLQQIRTQDLRFLLGYHRIAQELERIADYACDIAELAVLSSNMEHLEEVLQMANQTQQMYLRVVETIENEEDSVEALDQMDDVLDATYGFLQRQFLMGDQSVKTGSLAFALIFARTMERMGDHILNVAEAQVYIKTGKKF